MKGIETGCDAFVRESFLELRGSRFGILCNSASVTSSLRHILDEMADADVRPLRIFSPQHGFYGDKQANMIESRGFIHPGVKVEVVSLYGEMREPSAAMLEDLDVVVIDLPDVGARPYTYLWTSFLMLQAACRAGKRIIVLDRPNPLGGVEIEGPVLKDGYQSFVGLAPLPMRHGLTICEALRFACARNGLACDFKVVPLKGWKRSMLFKDTGLPWVIPSPNMPTPETAIVYPGTVMLEGTNISEGRGTTKPFELIGAPWIDEYDYAEAMSALEIPGVTLRPTCFVPMWDKYASELCRGVQVHVEDPLVFHPVKCAIAAIYAASKLWPEHFAWKKPPYEYEYNLMPIDIIYGSDKLREAIEKSTSIDGIISSWQVERERFEAERKPYLIYD